MSSADAIRTRIWREEAEPDNPFVARAAYCHGYDVYGEMLGQAGWADMVFLLIRGEAPSDAQAALLEALAVALANPGPRDPSVHAAMCGGATGSAAAASLMAALAVGAGRHGGARDVFDAMAAWSACGADLASWHRHLDVAADVTEIWPKSEHPAGFDPHGRSTPTIVRQVLTMLARFGVGPRLAYLRDHDAEIEAACGMPMAMTAVAAAAFADLALTPMQGEMLYLLLRLPGAAAHALEQRAFGHRHFPFYRVELEDDPAARGAP